MPIADVIDAIVVGGVVSSLLSAVWLDIKDRRIPNWVVLAILLFFFAHMAVNNWAGLVSKLQAGAIAFWVTYTFYMFKVIGAGDTKLFSAVALFAGMENLGTLALYTVMAGGLLSCFMLASRPSELLALVRGQGPSKFRMAPYGVAIAIGAVIVVWNTVRPAGSI